MFEQCPLFFHTLLPLKLRLLPRNNVSLLIIYNFNSRYHGEDP